MNHEELKSNPSRLKWLLIAMALLGLLLVGCATVQQPQPGAEPPPGTSTPIDNVPPATQTPREIDAEPGVGTIGGQVWHDLC
ncbi:MAG: hypothetical protein M3220_11985, partial [Chloroflexota bacterium]|nr:hypothetical protein [Chloroflexota bacterium]